MSSEVQIRRALAALKGETEAQKKRRLHLAGGERSFLEVLAFTASPQTPSPLAAGRQPSYLEALHGAARCSGNPQDATPPRPTPPESDGSTGEDAASRSRSPKYCTSSKCFAVDPSRPLWRASLLVAAAVLVVAASSQLYGGAQGLAEEAVALAARGARGITVRCAAFASNPTVASWELPVTVVDVAAPGHLGGGGGEGPVVDSSSSSGGGGGSSCRGSVDSGAADKPPKERVRSDAALPSSSGAEGVVSIKWSTAVAAAEGPQVRPDNRVGSSATAPAAAAGGDHTVVLATFTGVGTAAATAVAGAAGEGASPGSERLAEAREMARASKRRRQPSAEPAAVGRSRAVGESRVFPDRSGNSSGNSGGGGHVSVAMAQRHLGGLRWIRRWLSDVRWLFNAAKQRRGFPANVAVAASADFAAPLNDILTSHIATKVDAAWAYLRSRWAARGAAQPRGRGTKADLLF